ncbi:hypothetical protein KCP69_24650 [Salmonella enterica subsp. enterica]|nr:hypothetical protein KCP69_24650 [Salmonella enterica subsp. enterica]
MRAWQWTAPPVTRSPPCRVVSALARRPRLRRPEQPVPSSSALTAPWSRNGGRAESRSGITCAAQRANVAGIGVDSTGLYASAD